VINGEFVCKGVSGIVWPKVGGCACNTDDKTVHTEDCLADCKEYDVAFCSGSDVEGIVYSAKCSGSNACVCQFHLRSIQLTYYIICGYKW
jgi:hypothetical protein